ncbi:MAG: DPP IV N-terminal domain-containing protein, partial [Planctomycetota bacterium]
GRNGEASRPWYLGEKIEARGSYLSPRGDELILVTAQEGSGSSKRDLMPEYVTESTYVETEKVRPYVGEGRRIPQSARLLRTAGHETLELDWKELPGCEEAGEEEEKKAREGLSVWRVLWSPRGERAAMLLRSNDNHQRWIAVVESDDGRMTCVHHLVDDAWIGRFNEMGWTKDGEKLWFLSEESGWSHLQLAERQGEEFVVRSLSEGKFECSSVRLTEDESAFLVTANVDEPGRYLPYWIPFRGGEMRLVANELPGRCSTSLSPDGTRIVATGSSWDRPQELFLAQASPAETPPPAKALTSSASEAFRAISWTRPRIEAVQAKSDGRKIWVRAYWPTGDFDLDP